MYSEAIGSRIVFARIRGRPANLFVICVYVPLKGRTNPAQVDTYEALEALIGRAHFRDNVILMGDFNSRLRRKARNGEVTGKWSMHTYADEVGRKLEGIMTKYNLKAVSTGFQPTKGRAPYTYINNATATSRRLR